MESSFIANALQVNFDSVFDILDNDEMVQMFRALESTGLRGFLGCPSVLYEKDLGQFFDTALVKNGEILYVIHGKFVAITEDRRLEIVGEKAVSKKRPATASDAPVVKKKKTTTGKAATAEKDLTLVVVAQEAVPIHIVEPISDMPAECPHASKRKAPKRKLRFPTGSDDEIVEQEPAVETVVVKNKGTTSVDDVDNIIEQASATRSDDIAIDDTERSIAVNDEDDDIDGAENEISRTMTSDTAPKKFLKEPLRSWEDDDISGFKQSTETSSKLSLFHRTLSSPIASGTRLNLEQGWYHWVHLFKSILSLPILEPVVGQKRERDDSRSI
ncbi:splicing factor 3B subunit 1-like [Dorcoceras hygrometricum]|uniref:Splicing factor 3B subunit 1-like n=1 Tax=Dorcoceras hygrometricum TaxID=472368 RepID=A0A2Z7CPK2_9LAMI|nr:splicing factor 3B subunit 1-like [Dorcoceras hygrometricum]